MTHGVQYLKDMEQVIFMKDGEVAACGTYEQIQSQTPDFLHFISSDTDTEQHKEEEKVTRYFTPCISCT